MEGGGSGGGRGSSPGLVITRVRSRSCAFVFTRAHSFSFGGSCIHLWGVACAFAFVRGRSRSFLSGLERSCSFLGVRVVFVGGCEVGEV